LRVPLKHILFIILVILIENCTFSQAHNIRNFSTKQGLPNNIVKATFEDHLGRIWFGTQNGICVFDGKKFFKFENVPEIEGIDVSSIVQDKNKTIWIGTIGQGVLSFSNNKFNFYTTKEGLPSDEIKTLYIDKKNQLWSCTQKGLAYFEKDKFVEFIDEKGFFKTKNIAYSITQTKDGALWISVWGKGILKLDNGKQTYFTAEDGILDNYIETLNVVGDSLIIGTTEFGIVFYHNGKFTPLKIPELEATWVNSIIVKKSELGILTRSNFVRYSLIDQKYEVLTTNEGLSDNDIYSGIFDKFGNIWLTTVQGVNCILKERIYRFNEKAGLTNNSISYFYASKNNELFVGTNGNGVNVIDKDNLSITYLINSEIIDGLEISGIKLIKDKLWVTTPYSISIFKLVGENYLLEQEITQLLGKDIENLYTLETDNKNRIWLSCFGNGIYLIDGADTLCYNSSNLLPSNSVLTIFSDSKDNLWISINQYGLLKYDGKKTIPFTKEDQLKDHTVHSIAEDENGVLYFGYKTAGMSSFDGVDFHHYSKKDGLLSNMVNAITFDSNNNCWIGTEKGINKISFNSSSQISSILSFNESNGLITEEIKQNVLVFDGKYVWAATNEGLFMLATDEKVDKNIKPIIVSKGIRLFFDAVDWTKIGNNTFDELGMPASLALTYLDNHLTFEYNCVTLNDVKYTYILEGFDLEWSPWTEKTEVLYSNIPPGNYLFKVKAIDSYGVESKNILTIEIIISPPFWQTWWFRITVLLTIGLLIYGIFKWRTKALIERQQELEQQVEERTAEVVLQKNEAEAQRHLVEEKNKEISDSINYAERIQRSLLANEQLLSKCLNDYFIFFQPKDVVSGDFYWASLLNNGNLAFVNADSTGHGVPGAIMSMLNMNSLKESVVGMGLCEPQEILNNTRKIIKETLANDGSEKGGKDGMDCSIICFDLTNNKIDFAAANNPVWIYRSGELIEFKPDKMPVGKHDRDSDSFTKQSFDIQKGDIIYTLTDGMPDQFGGPKGKKYMYKALKELLIQIAPLTMQEQKSKLITEFKNWKGHQEQVDDVCIIGVRL
jgi:ligand-binding sensor domain-containing protein/serine phosphatase RsbU (regulator of sigma subunit)